MPEWIRPYVTAPAAPVLPLRERLEALRAAHIARNPRPAAPAAPAAAAPAIPEHIITQLREMQTALGRKVDCPICMEEKEPADTTMTRCGHSYCAPCLAQLKAAARHERQWTCAVCRSKHSH